MALGLKGAAGGDALEVVRRAGLLAGQQRLHVLSLGLRTGRLQRRSGSHERREREVGGHRRLPRQQGRDVHAELGHGRREGADVRVELHDHGVPLLGDRPHARIGSIRERATCMRARASKRAWRCRSSPWLLKHAMRAHFNTESKRGAHC